MTASHNHTSVPQSKPYYFQLFVAGNTAISIRAIQNSHQIFDKHLEGKYEIELIDIYQHPEKTLEANIISTPALIKKKPLPEVMVIGDLSDMEKVLKELLIP
jgi:circadian clock protein KaiB